LNQVGTPDRGPKQIKKGAVKTNKIATGAVTDKKLDDGAVMSDKLADAPVHAVTGDKGLNGSLGLSKMA